MIDFNEDKDSVSVSFFLNCYNNQSWLIEPTALKIFIANKMAWGTRTYIW